MAMLRVGFYGVFVILWVFWELALRRKHGLHPQDFRELLRYSQKKKSPVPTTPPLLFALLTLLIFSFWEAFLRAMLDMTLPWFVIAAGFATLTLFALRRLFLWEKSVPETRFKQLDLGLLLLGSALFLPSLTPLILGPWIYLRSRHLQKT